MEQVLNTNPDAPSLLSDTNRPENVMTRERLLYVPAFVKYVHKLSSKAKTRLLISLVSKGLESQDYEPRTQEEKECLSIGEHLIASKVILQAFGVLESEQEQKDKQSSSEEESTVANTDNKKEGDSIDV
jgi:hypothetical protein